jgi:predicted Holliday junction resolvase-like endonuclease
MDNSEKIKQFIVPIILLIAIVGLLGVGIKKISETASSYKSVKQDIVTKTETIKEKQATLEEYKRKEQEEKEKEKNNESAQKPFYKPIESGLDPESVIAGEFAEILQLVRANKIKVRSIKYDYEPKDDNFYINAKEKYNVARLNMEMISTYSDYDSFLKELYKHDHFIDIKSAEIVPYKKNKKILLIDFKVTLYSKK